jgi:hypothetical protein
MNHTSHRCDSHGSNILVDYSRESRKIIDVKASEVLGPTGCSLQVSMRSLWAW